jgi:hypothetical protein
MKIYRRPAWVAFVVCFAMLAAPATAQIGSLACSSNDGRYRYCRADTQNNVRLVRQLSKSRCDYRYSWGYDYRGIWVIVGSAIASSKSDNSDDVAANRRDYYLDAIGYRLR